MDSNVIDRFEQPGRKHRIGKMTKDRWDAVKQEGDDITRAIAARIDAAPDHAEVQTLMARHHAWIESFYSCSADVYRGLGKLYAEHPEFRASYEKHAPNLADFMRAAMTHYADHILEKRCA